MRLGSEGTLFLHYPCFDGLVSAAIAWDFLEGAKGWKIADFQPVNYDRAASWVKTDLPRRAAIVDFLYHPQAAFWADHHETTFASELHRHEYDINAAGHMLFYDPAAPSCGMMLFSALSDDLSDPERYRQMASWADRIDGAQYSSVEEAVIGSAPAIIINLSLTGARDDAYFQQLLCAMRFKTLDEVAALPEVRSRAEDVRARTQMGLRLVKNAVKLEPGGIAVFAVSPDAGDIVNRYSAYYFLPTARYSVALVLSPKDAKITAMRNPWIDFDSVPLGPIFKKYGGGGHQRVASVVIPANNGIDYKAAMASIVDEIRHQDVSRVGEAQRRSA